MCVLCRNIDSRVAAGTPELRFGARGKGVALPLVQISKRPGTQVVRADALPYRLAAVIVSGLNKVGLLRHMLVWYKMSSCMCPATCQHMPVGMPHS